MIIAKNDEDKRSRVWNYVTGITTVLIIIVAGYFIYQGFFGNPLEGKWKHDESDIHYSIRITPIMAIPRVFDMKYIITGRNTVIRYSKDIVHVIPFLINPLQHISILPVSFG